MNTIRSKSHHLVTQFSGPAQPIGQFDLYLFSKLSVESTSRLLKRRAYPWLRIILIPLTCTLLTPVGSTDASAASRATDAATSLANSAAIANVEKSAQPSTTGTATQPTAESKSTSKSEPATKKSAASGTPSVVIRTNLGDITVELNPTKAPKSTANFLAYVDDKFYDQTVFHRVIKGFMVQGGGFSEQNGRFVKKDTRPPVPNEARNGIKNKRGTIAMARTSDPGSATAQFFINHGDNDNLDYPNPDGHGYAVFGKVTKGMDVVDKIASLETTRRDGMSDVPKDAVTIKSIRRR